MKLVPPKAHLETTFPERYSFAMSTAEKIFQQTQALPEAAQKAVLEIVEQLALKYPSPPSEPLTLRETAELRAKLATWEEDWNAPGMETYDQP